MLFFLLILIRNAKPKVLNVVSKVSSLFFNSRCAFRGQHYVVDEDGGGGTAIVFIVDATCRTLNHRGRVVKEFVARFHIFEGLFERTAGTFYLAVTDAFIVDGYYSCVTVTFYVVLAICRSAFEL